MGEEWENVKKCWNPRRLKGVPWQFFKGFQMGKEGTPDMPPRRQPASQREGGDYSGSQLSVKRCSVTLNPRATMPELRLAVFALLGSN